MAVLAILWRYTIMDATFKKTDRIAPPSVEADPRWARVLARDRTADGEFWYSVATTGVYCRPSCPSRQALRKNVRFYGLVRGIRGYVYRFQRWN